MAMIGILVFVGAMTLAASVIWLSVAPQWRRIVRLAGGDVEQPFQPLGALAQAERRIAVKRWESTPTAALIPQRAAA